MKTISLRLTILFFIILAIISLPVYGMFVFYHQPSEHKPNEILLSETENAYNPIPNPNGKLLAYVRTGWGAKGGTGGFGKSNLISEVIVMTAEGKVLTKEPICDAFLFGWTTDGKNLICYRSWRYSIVKPDGTVLLKGELPLDEDRYMDTSERIAYLSKENSIVWLQNFFNNIKKVQTSSFTYHYTKDFVRSAVQGSNGEIAQYPRQFSVENRIIIPSPNERYIAIIALPGYLSIYDRENKTWSDLGRIIIHPDASWEYINPTWDPWFADSSQLTFLSEAGIVICSPDGKSKRIITKPKEFAGIPTASPDGKHIAFVTFEPRPRKIANDLKFWGGSTVWVTSIAPNSKAFAVTEKNDDTTYDLRWINNHQLVFDRLADEFFYSRSRLWKVEMTQ